MKSLLKQWSYSMRHGGLFFALMALSMGGIVRAAEVQLTTTSSVQEAVKDFSSEDFSTRQKALQSLEGVLAQQIAAMASDRDEETRASISTALEFNVGLIRWFQALQLMPDDVRTEEVQLISRREILPILGKLFSAKTMQRMEGIRQLATLDVPGVDGLLGQMIDSADRAVSITAMDAAWDRKPSPALVNALWRRAAPTPTGAHAAANASSPPPVVFRGRPMEGIYASPVAAQTDGDLATEVLIHYQSALVKEKLITFLQGAADSVTVAGAEKRWDIYNPTAQPFRDACLLVQAYKPMEAISPLIALATCERFLKYDVRDKDGFNCATNRTGPLAMVVLLTDQKQEDYGVKPVDLYGVLQVWACKNNDEDAVIKLRKWWDVNASKYGQLQKTSPVIPVPAHELVR